jgi:ArsR family transcriptional regulator, arsenate/arsenite/antimonite-responsive transcriptional repressor
MDRLFKTLGDQNRLRIINLLRRSKLCVCELEVILNTTQSNVSRHLSRLRNDKMIIFEKQAQWIYYSIDPEFLKDNELLYRYLEKRLNQEEPFAGDLERLDDYRASGENCETLKSNEKTIIAG